jgi:hypothetical protein
MEKNLPFVSLSFTDNAYNKFILPFLGKLDDGNVFKKIITLSLSISSLGLLIGGIYLTITGLFGDDGFIKNFVTNEMIVGGKKVGSIVGLLLGSVASIITAWSLFSILKKRTEQLDGLEYTGLLDFVFNKTLPKLILIIGELLFILLIYVSVLQIFASLVGSYVYAPLLRFPTIIMGITPGMQMFNQFIPNQIYGDYDHFDMYLKMGVLGFAASFIVLIAFYLYKEVYSYILKLATNLIDFLPKFALPLAIRRRNEN